MFSLIITIVSIALVAALALATLFYGGGAFRQGAADAQATKVVNQGQQLLAASELFYADKGQWPVTVEELVADGYLKTVPVAQLPLAQAIAANGEWTMPQPGEPVFLNTASDPETCRSVNSKGYGEPGILNTVHQNTTIQCFGKTLSALTVVVARNGFHLASVAQAASAGFTSGDLRTGDVPDDSQTTAWLVRPSAGPVPAVGAGSGGATPGGDTGGTGGDTGGTGDTGGGSGSGETEPPPPPPPPNVVFGADAGSNYYSVVVGQSKTLNFTYSNVGQGPATGIQAVIDGNADFSLVSNNCGTVASPGQLAAGSSCTLTARFAPSARGFYNANLVVTSNDANSPHAISLSGHGGEAASLQLSSTNLNLKTVPTVNVTQRLKLTAIGDIGDVTLTDLSIVGSNVTGLSRGTGCQVGRTLLTGEYCYVDVTFTPGVGAGFEAPAALRVGDSASGSTSDVTLAADSRYTPASPGDFNGNTPLIGGSAAQLSGNTVTWSSTSGGLEFFISGTNRDKGKFTVAYQGSAASLNMMHYNMFTSSDGYYGLDFPRGKVVTNGVSVLAGGAAESNFTKPTLAEGDRILLQMDYDNKTARWYHCGPTACDKPGQPFHTLTTNVSFRPYLYKPGNTAAATVTLQSSSVPGAPNATTFHNGHPK